MTIVSRIGELVDQRGWKITEFAEKADLAYNTAHDLYTGKASRIGLDILDRVCRVLETHPGELLIFVNDTPKPNKARLKKPELV
jgi:DNA-binding Xre family transcriptional regulator